jgi:RNA-directed DNA polymerase
MEGEVIDRPKPFVIPKSLVFEAYKLVKANHGGAGVDQQSLEQFDKKLKDNLYKIWNRLSSGSYFPPAVKGVEIPKKQGGTRLLGIPTVSDRIAQMTIKLLFEPTVEPIFLENSYAYRPNKSALEAIGATRERCWKYNWVVEFDIKSLFDNIDHELLMKVLRHHTDDKCILLYIERWLKASIEMPGRTLQNRDAGTPQGGVISLLLSNLFLHYVFDVWMTKNHPESPWCRYADDGICHCRTEKQAETLLEELKHRFLECKLELHPEKTKIIYCKDNFRKEKYHGETNFTFLGYEFMVRRATNSKTGRVFGSFLPAIGREAKKNILKTVRKLNIRNRVDLSLEAIAKILNPKLRGWINYYGKYTKSILNNVLARINKSLVKWIMKKYKRLKGSIYKTLEVYKKLVQHNISLFAHWKSGVTNVFI